MQQEIIYCNNCGRKIEEDYLSIIKQWGYFSKKDGTSQKISICEACYDEWVKKFKIPPLSKENTEWL